MEEIEAEGPLLSLNLEMQLGVSTGIQLKKAEEFVWNRTSKIRARKNKPQKAAGLKPTRVNVATPHTPGQAGVAPTDASRKKEEEKRGCARRTHAEKRRKSCADGRKQKAVQSVPVG